MNRFLRNASPTLAWLITLFVSACAGGGGGSAPTYTLGGSISGLTESGLTLTNNGGAPSSVPANATNFTFPGALASSDAYKVAVANQPDAPPLYPPLLCTVSDGSGTVGQTNVTSVHVTCVPTITGPQLPAGLGGSDYGWYYLAPPCNREPYGVVYNYDTATAIIDAQLQQMYNNGQRRLRIPIYHARGINSGTIMDSTGGNLAPQFQANLANLLAAVKAAGFVEIEVSFNPQSNNAPFQWTTFSDDYFQENWSLIQNLHPVIAGAGISYHIDLLNEGIPPVGYAPLLQYDQMLWNDYVSEFGKNDTLGFSIIADPAHVGQVSTVYAPSAFGNQGSPLLFDVHIYDETGNGFATAFNALTGQGYQGIPWIIGEAFYDDAAEAAALRQEVNSTGQQVLYLTQWPLTSDENCSTAVNLAPPVDFSNYQAQGF